MSGIVRRVPLVLSDITVLTEQWLRHSWSKACFAGSGSENFKQHSLAADQMWKKMEELKKQVEQHTKLELEGKQSPFVLRI